MLGASCWALVVVIMLALAVWDAGYLYKGRHRGAYEPNPEWRPEPKPIVWTGTVTFSNANWNATIPRITLQPLIAGPPPGTPPEAPVGRFGDLDIDRADRASVRPFLPDGSVDDQWLKEGGWHSIGTLATVE